MSASVRAAAVAGVGLILASSVLVGAKIAVLGVHAQTTADMAALAAARPIALSYMNTGTVISGPTGCEVAARIVRAHKMSLAACVPHPGVDAVNPLAPPIVAKGGAAKGGAAKGGAAKIAETKSGAAGVASDSSLGPIRGAGVRIIVQSQLDIPGWGTQVISRKAHAIVR